MNAIVVDPADANHVYVAFSGYREGDDAATSGRPPTAAPTWTNISGNLPNAPVDSVVLDTRDNIVIVSGDLGVFWARVPPAAGTRRRRRCNGSGWVLACQPRRTWT